ncbi:hypothetical protein [Salipiger mucosus]|nr:hypothetical protein [Salipiger mucosus]
MTWTALTRTWPQTLERLQRRFPHLDRGALAQRTDKEVVTAHIAERHDLTQSEAREALDDWLMFQSLETRQEQLAG